MDPMTLLIAASLVGLGIYFTRSKKPSDVQVHSGTTATGIPVHVVVPVAPSPEVTHPVVNAPPPSPKSGLPPLPTPYTANIPAPHEPVNYQPTPVIVPTSDGSLTLAPTIITPTGAASLSVQSVKDSQNALNTLGIPSPLLTVDGIAGPKTQAAVRQFQATQGMAQTGNLDDATRNALSKALATLGQTSTPNGGANPVVQAASPAAPMVSLSPVKIQHALNLLGAKPALVEDGQIGPKSQAAIRAFQLSHGLTVDGIAGPKTQAALSIAVTQSGQTL